MIATCLLTWKKCVREKEIYRENKNSKPFRSTCLKVSIQIQALRANIVNGEMSFHQHILGSNTMLSNNSIVCIVIILNLHGICSFAADKKLGFCDWFVQQDNKNTLVVFSIFEEEKKDGNEKKCELMESVHAFYEIHSPAGKDVVVQRSSWNSSQVLNVFPDSKFTQAHDYKDEPMYSFFHHIIRYVIGLCFNNFCSLIFHVFIEHCTRTELENWKPLSMVF